MTQQKNNSNQFSQEELTDFLSQNVNPSKSTTEENILEGICPLNAGNEKTPEIQQVLNSAPAGHFRIRGAVLSKRAYCFLSKENINMEGISFLVTDGNIRLEDKFGGLEFTKHSISMANPEKLFNKLPNPPFIAILEFTIRGKNYVLTRILDENTLIEAQSKKEGGIK